MMKKALTKLIVITGVSRGLGLAMTEQFVQAGHTVLGCARSSTALEQLRQKFGAPHDFSVVNVADDQQVKAWTERLITQYQPPNLLINNAALINELATL